VRSDAGAVIRGGLIVLPIKNTEQNVASVRDKLALREGAAKGSSSKIKDEQIAGFHVVYADFDAAIMPEQLNGETLAAYATASVQQCVKDGHAFNNGIRYLLENLEWGVVSPLTDQYAKAILQGTHCNTLADAEHKLMTEAAWIAKPTK
jgi:hypothetical protein